MGGRTLAVDVREAREVMRLDVVASVPGAPAPLLGVANLRGTVLAVADARPLLALAPKPAPSGGAALTAAPHATFNSLLFRRYQLARNVGDAFRDVMAERLDG